MDLFESLQMMQNSSVSDSKESLTEGYISPDVFKRIRAALNKNNKYRNRIYINTNVPNMPDNRFRFSFDIFVADLANVRDMRSTGNGDKIYTAKVNVMDETIDIKCDSNLYYSTDEDEHLKVIYRRLIEKNESLKDISLDEFMTICKSAVENVKQLFASKNFYYRISGTSGTNHVHNWDNDDYNMVENKEVKTEDEDSPEVEKPAIEVETEEDLITKYELDIEELKKEFDIIVFRCETCAEDLEEYNPYVYTNGETVPLEKIKIVTVENHNADCENSEENMHAEPQRHAPIMLNDKTEPVEEEEVDEVIIDESTTLTEDFDKSMPIWLAKAIKHSNSKYDGKNYSSKYPLDTMTWTETSFPDKGKLFDNGVIAVLIDDDGNQFVYSPDLNIGINETIYVNGRERRVGTMSIKALAPYVKKYAYANAPKDAADEVKNKVNDRYQSRDGMPTRHDVKDWRLTLDKSGYVVDPEKYKKILAANNASKYSDRLDDLYVVLTGVRRKLQAVLTRDDMIQDPAADRYSSAGRGKLSRVKDAFDKYNSAVRDYQYATEEIERISNGKESSWRGPAYQSFDKYVASSEKEIVACLDILKQVEGAE